MRKDKIIQREMSLGIERGKENLNFVTLQVPRRMTWQTFVIYFALKFGFLSFSTVVNLISRGTHLSTVTIVDLAGWFFQSAVLTYRHHAANRP